MRLALLLIAMSSVCGAPTSPTITSLEEECAEARRTGIRPAYSCHGFESYRLNGIVICRYDARGDLIPGFDGTDERYCAVRND